MNSINGPIPLELAYLINFEHLDLNHKGDRGVVGDQERGPPPPKSGGATNQSVTKIGDQNRWGFTEEREERGKGWTNEKFLFFFNKKPSHLRGECRYQFRVLGEFKRGVDVAHEDWLCVREGTPLLDHP
ncbi:hypothetical protein HanHA300_Chr03g0101381 [Helianthus annuus]|nr:hypothetical protein HanHA300_Chr03g0101381 [Helianthus annuus]KAJ0608808.1 hypothetical protein HanHA89_Chr03g0113081 [Helianthus annuus]